MKHIPSIPGAEAEPLQARAGKHFSSRVRKGTEKAMLSPLYKADPGITP